MGKKRTSYSAEFKREAVRLVAEQGLTVVQVAADLGVSRNTLYAWVRDLEAEAAEWAADETNRKSCASYARKWRG